MTITITLDDKSDVQDQLCEFFGIAGNSPEEISAGLSEQIKGELISRAIRGQAAIDQKAAEAAQISAKVEISQSITVSVKAESAE